MYLYAERAQLVSEAFTRSACLKIKDISEIINASVSVARQLVKEMEAAGELVIVPQGFRRIYFRDWPTAEQMPMPKRPGPPKERKRTECCDKGMVMLRSAEERKGNTRVEECRQFNGLNLRVTQLLRQASQRAA